MMRPRIPSFDPDVRRRPWRRRLALALGVLAVIVGTAVWLDRRGAALYAAGRDADVFLRDFAAEAARRPSGPLDRFFSDAFSGPSLGLGSFRDPSVRDGIEVFQQRPGGGRLDRAGAMQEWQRYLSEFDAVDEVDLHVETFVRWSGTAPEAIVAVEVIGRPAGAPRAGVDRARLRVTFDRSGGRMAFRTASLVSGERVMAQAPQFHEVGEVAGIAFENRYYPSFLTEPLKFRMIRYGPGGISAADYDGDGLYDLFVPDGVESRLLRNGGDGTFADVTAAAGLAGLDGVSVGVFADYDNDGDRDLFVSRTFKPNQLFRNQGDGTFVDVTAGSGLGADCCTTVASWGDYDNDGFLDLYVGRYLDPRKDIPTALYARNGEPNQLYRNNGNGSFANVTERAGVGDPGLCLGSVWGDYDNDGWLDLYVANDFGRNTLYHNERDGTFTDVAARTGTLAYGAGMSASFGDYDNDGHLDLYVANIRTKHAWFAEFPTVARYLVNMWAQGVWVTDLPLYMQVMRQSGFDFVDVFRQMASGNNLLRNRGDGTFEDTTEAAGAHPIGWFWGSGFADFDNDGWQDIYAANGWVYNTRGTEIEREFLNNVVSRQREYKTGLFFDPAYFERQSWHGWERNRHLRNNGDGTFTEIATAAGTDLLRNSRGIAVADFWNRGVLDIAVAASSDRHALLRNDLGQSRRWIAVELTGTTSNRDAVGARVSVTAGGKRQVREVVAGDGYGSQSSLRQYFGLGESTVVETLEVRWPRSGRVQTFHAVPAGRILIIREDQDAFGERPVGSAPH